jgi:hypothetical protein
MTTQRLIDSYVRVDEAYRILHEATNKNKLSALNSLNILIVELETVNEEAKKEAKHLDGYDSDDYNLSSRYSTEDEYEEEEWNPFIYNIVKSICV